MSSEIVIPRTPTLPVWASSRLNALLKSKTADRFDRIFEATFAKNVDVVFNGKSLTRDEYKKLLLAQSEGGPVGIVDLQIEGETVFTPSQDRSGGFVGMFYTTVGVNKRIFFRGAPVRYKEVSSINLTVESTVPCPPVRLRYFDSRRITAVNQVLSPASHIVSFPQSVIPANEASISGKVDLGQVSLNIVEGEEGLSVLGNKFSTASVPEAEIDEE
ncbi:hypothetical protein EDD15DRAFT_1889109 [Pisolithus albus]|nr:hypothetical protein EDD15DRAFT_1889109 [Pisolithus albus]